MTPTNMASAIFFFNDTATTEIYTLSLHDALPIYVIGLTGRTGRATTEHLHFEVHFKGRKLNPAVVFEIDRKSTRLNSSHANISYAVFCLKKTSKYGSTKASTSASRSAR